jgi:23S rRNA pseudouridine1911/1915/1917 synthase
MSPSPPPPRSAPLAPPAERAPLVDGVFVVSEAEAGLELARVLRERSGASWGDVRRAIDTGKVWVGRARAMEPRRRVVAGEELSVRMRAERPDRAAARSARADVLVYTDASVAVVRKPAGIMTIPFEGEAPDGPTLDAVVRDALAHARPGRTRGRPPLGVVHRLDKATSGVLVFACSVAAKRHLAQQFRVHSVHRRYLAVVAGHAREVTHRSHLVPNRGDGFRGSTEAAAFGPARREGQLAVTHVEVVERFADATLVACQLETGRTHQIRIHLAEAGTPVLGDPVYGRAHAERAPRLMLHAAELGFAHPADERPMRFAEPPPVEFEAVVRALRGAR